ncbi:hypothetical protein POM88_053431 [Heracleum sosnowskyi]|uniref:Uncharacterized protein n=1 Tax=Heracleum sosnowskyi TaxID=360622 RepID=A0AAD8GP85_9APIA|nr:hypothetical protein POM88_053431 [Heracleum sosnowskyi]
MADAIVSFAVERLADLLISETKLLYGVRDQINEIQRELKRMQNFLKEADKKQIQDERVRGWVDEIKELAFRTEDAIEIFALQVGTSSGFKEAEKVLKGILKQLLPDEREKEVSNMEVLKLVDELRKVQQEKKCLIVIDDIWTVDSWRLLEPAFSFPLGDTTAACKILLTTRNLTVAKIGSLCEIPEMTEDEGWQLLSKKARIYDQPGIRVTSQMETIGRNMVKRCKGHKYDNEFRASMVRRLCVRSYDSKDKLMLEPYDKLAISHIRSLFVRKDRKDLVVLWPEEIFSLERFKLLRVLTARGYELSVQNIRSISQLVYLKYLCLRECRFKFLPSSIGNLRNLETFDGRAKVDALGIPDVLWKLKKLKHLYLPDAIWARGRAKKLRLEGLNELQLIHNFNSEFCDAHDLFRLPNLKVFKGHIIVQENLTVENIIDFTKSRELRHTDIYVIEREVSLVILLECNFIDELRISGTRTFCPKMYDYTRFSGRLTALWLADIEIEEDRIILVGKLPNLRRLSIY